MNLKKIKKLLTGIFLAVLLQNTAISAEREINCLSAVVFFESRGENLKGQEAVAQVVMNRVNHPAYPNSVCKVVLQPRQFSWANDLTNSARSLLKGSTKHLNKQELSSYQQARQVALRAFYGVWEYNAKIQQSLYFVHKSIQPSWTKNLKKDATIGNHRFYSERK